MVQFSVSLKYKSSLEHDLVPAVASLPLGNEFSGFMRWGFLHHSSIPGVRSSLQSKPSLIPAGTAQLYPNPAGSSLSRIIKSLNIDRKSFRASGKKKNQVFPCESQCLFFPVVAGVCYVDIKFWGMREDTDDFGDSSSPQFAYTLHE